MLFMPQIWSFNSHTNINPTHVSEFIYPIFIWEKLRLNSWAKAIWANKWETADPSAGWSLLGSKIFTGRTSKSLSAQHSSKRWDTFWGGFGVVWNENRKQNQLKWSVRIFNSRLHQNISESMKWFSHLLDWFLNLFWQFYLKNSQ